MKEIQTHAQPELIPGLMSREPGREPRRHWTWDQLIKKGIIMDKKTITGWSIAVTWSDGKRENILDIPDEVAQYVDDYLTEIEEHGDLAKPSTEFVRDKSL